MRDFIRVFSVTALLLLSTPDHAQTVSNADDAEAKARAARTWPVNVLTETFGFDASTPAEVPLSELIQGCPARDCIPAIENPKFVNAADAGFLADDDIVLAISVDGVHRAYPTSILARHEIVNDTIAGQPIAITYCPLCGSGAAFSRRIGGEVTSFGVSGVLHNSDLVLYDRASNTLWAQVIGRGIVGTRNGEDLTSVPLTQVEWKEWRSAHPDTQVLSTDTGFDIAYTANPYGDYASSDKVFFPLSNRDARIHPKMVVFGMEIGDASLAVTDEYLRANPRIETELAGEKLVIERAADGMVNASRADGSVVPAIRLFWFAWASFHPKTELRALPR